MTKFNVGDKVRVCADMVWQTILAGKIVTIKGIAQTLEFRSNEVWYEIEESEVMLNENCLEPIEPVEEFEQLEDDAPTKYEPRRSMKEPELQKTIGEINPMTRASILAEAAKIVTTDREQQYGSPEDNFGLAARYWTTYFGKHINAHDIAMAMTLLKLSRIQSGQVKPDNYIDGCGYLACGAEIAGKEAK